MTSAKKRIGIGKKQFLTGLMVLLVLGLCMVPNLSLNLGQTLGHPSVVADGGDPKIGAGG